MLAPRELTHWSYTYLINTMPGQSGVHVFDYDRYLKYESSVHCKFNKLYSLCVLVKGMNNEWKEETTKF